MPSITDLLYGGGDPLTPTLPGTMTALDNKYAKNLNTYSERYPAAVVNSLVDWEMQRAQRGVSPVSNTKTLDLLQAATTHQAVAKPAKRDPFDLLGNLASDVGDIVTSIPKLPVQLFNEVKQLPQLPKYLADHPSIEGLLSAPGIRLVPGTYTLKNLLSGNIGELASHPLMTALDVAPIAGELGVGEKLASLPIGESTVGDIVGQAKGAIRRSLPGRTALEAFGQDTRNVSRIIAEKVNQIGEMRNPAMDFLPDGQLADVMRDARTASIEYHRAIGGDMSRDAEIVGALESGQGLGSLDLSDTELAATNKLLDVRDRLTQLSLDAGELQRRTIQGGPEILTNRQAGKLDDLTANINRSALVSDLHTGIQAPSQMNLRDLGQRITDTLNGDFKMSYKRRVAVGYVHALDAAGYDTYKTLDLARTMSKDQIPDYLDSLNTIPLHRPAELAPQRATASQAWLDQNESTVRNLPKLREKYAKAEAKTLPARWQPLVAETKRSAVESDVVSRLTPDDPQLPEVLGLVNDRNYGELVRRELIDPASLKLYEKEAIASISQLREAGLNPEFVHHVSPGAATAIEHPALSSIIAEPSQIRNRIADWTPTNQSLSVSVEHQGVELARRAAVQEALPEIRDMVARPYSEWLAENTPLAQRLARRRGTDFGTEIEKLSRKTITRWSETERGFNPGASRPPNATELTRPLSGDELVIPRHIADSLKMLQNPPAISRMLDPVTKVFRYSVLPFSPRFQVNNIGGGMIMGVLEDPRFITELPRALKAAYSWRKAMQAMAKGGDAAIPETIQEMIASWPRSFRAQMGSLEFSAGPEGLFQLKAGAQLSRLGWAAAVGRGVRSLADWSFGVNQMFDDMYRAANYLSAEKNALKAGMTSEEAARAGMELVNKVQPRWLEMTPMERSVIRPLVPFYAFMSHVFRYAYQYPIDHPWRMATIDAFTRAEQHDYGTGLPQALMSAFFLGSPDSKGNQTAIDIGASNPFRNLGDDLTLGGFLGETNPIFKVALQQVGYDPGARGANIYPDIEYDPKTGGMRAKRVDTPGLIGQIVGGLIPQTQVIAALLGASSSYKEMVKSNPEAAQRLLASELGIPLLWKNVNIPQAAFRSELNRQQAQKAALSAAVKTGDYGDAARYPNLAPALAQLQGLSSTAASHYAPDQSAAVARAQIKWSQGQ